MKPEVLLQSDASLTGSNTLGFSVVAEHLCQVEQLPQLQAALALAKRSAWPVLLLGGGSNLILSERLPGLVIQLNNRGISCLEQHAGQVIVDVAAGENWHDWVAYSLSQGWFGLENMALIPGTVGAAPIQNIGAYGVELKDCFHSLTAWDRQQQRQVTLYPHECDFGYRHSIFKGVAAGRYVIWTVRFRLSTTPDLKLNYGGIAQYLSDQGIDQPQPLDLFNAVCDIRRSKLPDPAQLGNVGSFFENPRVTLAQYEALKRNFPTLVAFPAGEGRMKLAAGWLIDQAGWKGYCAANVGVYEKQALVLVNHGGGDRRSLLALAAEVQQSVREKFGVMLSIEPRQYPAA
ncbi:MAG: UDP-N-acetylmuramate dehydrogenase [Marinobacterium sp.]|nr:UDP-N-acetylmuramate dehydrogenase [Marinobacterium sp.]